MCVLVSPRGGDCLTCSQVAASCVVALERRAGELEGAKSSLAAPPCSTRLEAPVLPSSGRCCSARSDACILGHPCSAQLSCSPGPPKPTRETTAPGCRQALAGCVRARERSRGNGWLRGAVGWAPTNTAM